MAIRMEQRGGSGATAAETKFPNHDQDVDVEAKHSLFRLIMGSDLFLIAVMAVLALLNYAWLLSDRIGSGIGFFMNMIPVTVLIAALIKTKFRKN